MNLPPPAGSAWIGAETTAALRIRASSTDFRAADVPEESSRSSRSGGWRSLEILVGPGELAVEVDVLVAQPEGVGDPVRGGAATVVGDLVRRVLRSRSHRAPSFLAAMVVPSAPRLIAMYP